MQNKLKAWLKRNMLTQDETDFTAVVESFGSVSPKEVIKELVEEGTELKAETILDVVTRYNRKCIELALRGYNVNTGLVLMRAVIKGIFFDKKWNPEKHRVYMAINQGADIRAAVAETSVEIMGEHPDPMSLFNITDLSTGNTNGMLTRGFNAELKGTYIKVSGDDEACGIWFRNIETGEDIKLDSQYMAINEPSRVLIIVPQGINPATYELRIVTQFTTGPVQLKQPRSVILPYTLEIV